MVALVDVPGFPNLVALPQVRDQRNTLACCAYALSALAEIYQLHFEKTNIELDAIWIHQNIAQRDPDRYYELTDLALKLRDARVMKKPNISMRYPDLGLTRNDQEHRNSIDKGLPVAVEITIDEHFRFHNSEVPYELHGQNQEPHAVVIVGYNDDSWLCRNSYGPAWGIEGYFLTRVGGGVLGSDTIGYSVYSKPVHGKYPLKRAD